MGATAREGSSAPATRAAANVTDASRAKARQAKRAKPKVARAKSAQGPDMFQGWQEEAPSKRRVQRQ
jgi:hypothetical protein